MSLTDSPSCCDVLQGIARDFVDKQDEVPVRFVVRLNQVEARLAKRRWERSRAAHQETRAAELRAIRAAESRRRWLERGTEATEKQVAEDERRCRAAAKKWRPSPKRQHPGTGHVRTRERIGLPIRMCARLCWRTDSELVERAEEAGVHANGPARRCSESSTAVAPPSRVGWCESE